MTLYLKYRPQVIDELDLASVRESLKNIIASKNIPHAFLFAGPKGTGKTSAARILAKIINCTDLKKGEPCNKCDSCLSIMKGSNIDVVELDAASNRGIDDIRALRESVYLAPARARKKIYIIDEVHMLTLEAANAFLKTLEEPPEHVVFILATTNPEKLPATVISRLTTINFNKATGSDVKRQLLRVAKGEKIKIEEAAIEKIAKLSDGSFRDAVKILENLSFKTKDIKLTDIGGDGDGAKEFFRVIESKNSQTVLEFIEGLIKKGVSLRWFMDEIIGEIHGSLLAKNGIGEDRLAGFSQNDLIGLIHLISDSKEKISPLPQLPLEIAVLKFCGQNTTQKIKNSSAPLAGPELEVRTVVKKEPKEEKKDEKEVKPRLTVSGDFDTQVWQKILEGTHDKNISIEALLRSAKPISFDGKSLTVGVYYKFHKDKLEEVKNSQILEGICEEVLHTGGIRLVFELIERDKTKKVENKTLTTKVDVDIIDAAKEIFG